MQNDSIILRNIMGFKLIDLDLSDLGKIIAIVGDNGAGKSTLMECLGFSGLYREFPSKDQAIPKYCGDGAYIENWLTHNGEQYRTRIVINPNNGKMESYLFKDGKPVNDGKSTTFDEHISRIFGRKELILCSYFAAQEDERGFLNIPKADRKELFLSMLDLGGLQKISSHASDYVTKEKSREDEIGAVIKTLETAASCSIPDKEQLIEARQALDEKIIRLEIKSKEIAIEKSSIDSLWKSRDELAAKSIKLSEETESIEKKQLSIISKISSLSEQPELPNINDIAILEVEADSIPSIEAEMKSINEERMAIQREKSRIDLHNSDIRHKVDSIRSRMAVFEKDLKIAKNAVNSLKELPCGGVGIYESCKLISDATKSKANISFLEEKLLHGELEINQAKGELITVFPEDTIEMERLTIIMKILKKAKESHEQLSKINEIKAKQDAVKQTIKTLEEQYGDLEKTKYDKTLEKEKVREAMAALPEIKSSQALAEEAKTVEVTIHGLKGQLHTVTMDIGKADTIKKNVESAREEIVKLKKELAEVQRDKRQWDHIHHAFGPKEIQAVEIDSAGPIINDIVNDLLMSCFGSRFSVKFVTQIPKADKSGYKDFFDIQVIDSERERSGFIGDLSGGERVIVGEAVSLGIALYNSQVGGIKWDTLYRDECSGALSTRNAPAYIKMLRKALEIGGFKRLFFIAHQPDLVKMADSKLLIENGQVFVS